ncbi:MAG: 30S ribosomal protein S18 [Chloroflexi bacterium]|jgi:small subunit ribosomal protein S18|nr:30S ribosomal protein S18 [Chloroflexota bacterium]MBT5628392.1 30S ribosomal protein S18 [Chloroflexota bacterium]
MTTPRTPQAGGSRPPFRRGGRRRRQCFCKESTVDYKDVSSIRRFITDRGRIEAGKKQGNCAKCQRNLTTAIKRARHLALLPYAPDHLRVTGTVSTSKISDEDEETTNDEATESTEAAETAEVTEDAPVAEAAAEESEVAEEETESEETEAPAEDVSTDEASDAPEEDGAEEVEAESSDEEDK